MEIQDQMRELYTSLRPFVGRPLSGGDQNALRELADSFEARVDYAYPGPRGCPDPEPCLRGITVAGKYRLPSRPRDWGLMACDVCGEVLTAAEQAAAEVDCATVALLGRCGSCQAAAEQGRVVWDPSKGAFGGWRVAP